VDQFTATPPGTAVAEVIGGSEEEEEEEAAVEEAAAATEEVTEVLVDETGAIAGLWESMYAGGEPMAAWECGAPCCC
jgi:hypothetical protein